jgi:hypothetical protein
MIDPKEVIDFMNGLVALDHDAIESLIDKRVVCNKDLSDHPTVQIGANGVGLLGILNGLCGTITGGKYDGWGFIAANYDDDDNLTGFQLTNKLP